MKKASLYIRNSIKLVLIDNNVIEKEADTLQNTFKFALLITSNKNIDNSAPLPRFGKFNNIVIS